MSFLAAIPILGKALDGIFGTIDKAVPNKDLKMKLKAEIEKIKLEHDNELLQRAHDEIIGQIEINKEEAKSKSVFVAGWRPFIGWCCGVSLAANFILFPLMPWLISIISIWQPEASNIPLPPQLSLNEMMPVLLGMLGLGGYRTYEKTKGVHSK